MKPSVFALQASILSLSISEIGNIVRRVGFAFRRQQRIRIVFLMMLAGIWVIPEAVYAIPDPPCECSNFTTIGSPETETNISSLTGGLSPNTCYFVRGTLVINSPTVWSNVRLSMDEGSRIQVDAGLLVLHSYIEGCDVLWQGIHVSSFENIGVFYSIIGSAEYGIRLEGSAGIACQYNEFVNCYIGISAGSPFEEDQFDVTIEQKEPIMGCKFYTVDAMPDPYPGQFYDPSWPSDLAIPYDHGFAAVYIEGAVGLHIGRNNATGADRNKIYNMRNGIVVRYSVSNITGTDIYDLQGGLPATLPDPVLDLNQRGIHCEWSSSDIYQDTIRDVLIGIHSIGSRHSIHHNTLDILKTPGPQRTRGIRILEPQSISITTNSITNGMRGIEVRDVFNRLEISKNILTRDITTPGNVGVFVLDLRLQANQVGLIQQNIITMTDGDGSIGIHVGNTEDLQITDNIVNYVVDAGEDYQNQGINCYASLRTVIQHNVINADSAYIGLSNRGIAVTMSSNSNISCNEIENMGECLHIWGFNMETRVAMNEFADGNFGLYLVEPVFLGTQTHTGNEWVGTYNDFGAFIEGDNPVTTAEMSTFIVDAEANSDFLPFPIGPEAVDEGNWFVDIEGPVGLNCETIPPSPPDLHADTLVQFLEADSVFANYNEELQWMRKADLFELLLLEPSLTSNAVLDSFFDAEDETVLGQLVQGQRILDFRYGMVTARKYPVEDTLTLLAAELMEIDSILILGPVDSAALMVLRSLKTDSLAGYFSDWLTYISDEQSVSDSIYADMADSLDVLSPAADIEEFLVYALELKIKHKRGIGYTAGELSDIEDLAGMCLLEGGRAVLIGHGLYGMYNDSLFILDPAGCMASSPLVTGLEDEFSEPIIISDLVIYPNPGGDFVQIESPNDILSVAIYNIQGRYVLGDTSSGGGRKALVDTSMLDTGVYLLRAGTRLGTYSSLISIVR